MDKLKKDNIWRFVEGLNLDIRRRQLIGKLIEEIVDSFADGVPAASNDNIGSIKTGYTQNGKNYPVTLDGNKKAYVNVPWTDTKYNLPAATPNSIGGVKQGPKVANASSDADTVALGTKINELIASLRSAGVII